MSGIILLMGFFVGMASAFAAPADQLEGLYTNSAYDGPYSYQNAWVEIRIAEQGGLGLVFNVPCGSKLAPRIFKINQTSSISGDLELIEEGSSQCYTGQNPSFILLGNKLIIDTDLRIGVPGFNGSYELTK
jgi:hypothetical protein